MISQAAAPTLATSRARQLHTVAAVIIRNHLRGVNDSPGALWRHRTHRLMFKQVSEIYTLLCFILFYFNSEFKIMLAISVNREAKP